MLAGNQTKVTVRRALGPSGNSAKGLEITRYGNGGITFTDVRGHTVRTDSNEAMTKLFEALKALS
ncbi:hypothetical protein [Magnetospira sp. QH-2]|uniref:hypothetical protein n=1 Tax=Magnetospira sp. (strain QH-2) TaxID=1288970 RepID=UPI0003E81716|nr:hypothetical protein [Magnetospira sp. QH-2]CCQ73929.1 Protein of unknown function [Magnetospira sp. QH-2]